MEMIHAILLSIALMLSGSVRTSKLADAPLDYEISSGVEIGDKNVEAWTWFEREAGLEYTGVDVQGKYRPVSLVEAKGFFKNRQAQNMLRGGTSVALAWGIGRWGVVQSWDHYDPATAMHIGIESKYVKIGTDFYRDGLENGYVKAEYPLKAWKHIEIVPTYKYSIDRRKQEFMQGKIVLKVKG